MVKNCKAIGGADGYGTASISNGTDTIENFFNMNAADNIIPGAGNVWGNNIVTWQSGNGAVVQFSWTVTKGCNVILNNIDVIHPNGYILGMRHGTSSDLHDYTINNMWVEGNAAPLVDMRIQGNPYTNPPNQTALGSFRAAHFNNITVTGTTSGNILDGGSAGISDINFLNLKVNGSYIASASQMNLQLFQGRTTVNQLK